MKRLSLLLLGLVLGSAGVYGQMAIGTNFSISGDATATAGYDLDDQVFGFKNEAGANIKLELVAKQSSKKPEEMMSGWYGSIELNDFRIIIDSDEEETELLKTASGDPASVRSKLWVTEPEIVATLKNGPLFMKIYAAPSNKADLVAHVEDDEDDDYKAEGDDDDKDVGSEINKGHGITLGYDTADLDLAVGISSEEEFKENDDSTFDKGSYAVSADLGVNVGPAKLDVSFVQGLKNNDDENKILEDQDVATNDDDSTGIGVKLTTTFGTIELAGGADVELTGDQDIADTSRNEAMNWEGGAEAMVALTPNSKLEADFIFSSVEAVASDVAVKLSDKSGLVQDLDFSLRWGLYDITGGDADSMSATENDLSDLLVEGSLDYHIAALGGKLTPGTTIKVNQLDGSEDQTFVGLELRAVLTEAIPATEFGLKWATDQLVESGTNEVEQGTISLWTKIKY